MKIYRLSDKPIHGDDFRLDCNRCDGRGWAFERRENGTGVGECPACKARRADYRFELNAYRSKEGAVIEAELVRAWHGAGTVSAEMSVLASERPRSALIIDEASGVGKTLAMKAWYNRILRQREGWVIGLFWFSESELYLKFRDDDAEDWIQSIHRACRKFWAKEQERPEGQRRRVWFFLNEFFHERNWRTADSGRDIATLQRQLFFEFFDGLIYESEFPVQVVISANRAPVDVLRYEDTQERALCRRIYEATETPWPWSRGPELAAAGFRKEGA